MSERSWHLFGRTRWVALQLTRCVFFYTLSILQQLLMIKAQLAGIQHRGALCSFKTEQRIDNCWNYAFVSWLLPDCMCKPSQAADLVKCGPCQPSGLHSPVACSAGETPSYKKCTLSSLTWNCAARMLHCSWSPNSTDLYFWHLYINRQIQKTQ